jgi:hypothetical protein
VKSAATLCVLATLAPSPLQAKLSRHDGEAVIQRLDIDAVRQCGGGVALLQMSGRQIVETCEAAIAAVGAARSSEKSVNADKAALYDLFEANMWLGRTFGVARQFGNPSAQACESFARYAEVLGKVDIVALGPDFEDELVNEIEPATEAIKACTQWTLARRKYDATAPRKYDLHLIHPLSEAFTACAVDFERKIRDDPVRLSEDCERANGVLDQIQIESPDFFKLVGVELNFKRAQFLTIQSIIELHRTTVLPATYCRYAEQANAALILVDPALQDRELQASVAGSWKSFDTKLRACRARFHTPPLAFRQLHVN